jgi:hypothetical protein
VKVSSFCLLGALVPTVGCCADGGGSCSCRLQRGSCRFVFNVVHATRWWARVADSCGCSHASGFLDESGESFRRSETPLSSGWHRQGWCGFWGAPASFVLFPYFCEREGLCDGIPDGGVGGGWWVTGSSVLRLVAPDLCSTPALHKVAANGRSSSKCAWALLLGVDSCGFNNELCLL